MTKPGIEPQSPETNNNNNNNNNQIIIITNDSVIDSRLVQ